MSSKDSKEAIEIEEYLIIEGGGRFSLVLNDMEVGVFRSLRNAREAVELLMDFKKAEQAKRKAFAHYWSKSDSNVWDVLVDTPYTVIQTDKHFVLRKDSEDIGIFSTREQARNALNLIFGLGE